LPDVEIAAWPRSWSGNGNDVAFGENDITPAVLPELSRPDPRGLRAGLEAPAAAPTPATSPAIELRAVTR
jgi:hypothetical protein